MPKKNFFTELKRRNLFKVASIYAVTAWLIIQVVATIFPILEFPHWSQRWVIIMALLGFPVALVMAWVNEVAPEKQLIDQQENTQKEAAPRRKPHWLGYLTVLLIGIIGTALYFNRVKGGQNQELLPSSIRESRIAVLPYNNYTNDEDLEALGDITANWINQGMMNIEGLKVVSPLSAKHHLVRVKDVENSLKAFQKRTGAEKVISGAITKEGKKLIFQSEVMDPLSGLIDFTFPVVVGKVSEPTAAMEEVRQRILSHFVMKNMKKRRAGYEYAAYENPPKYDALSACEDGIAYFGVDYQRSLESFERAIALDSNYLTPHIYIVHVYGNAGQRSKRDSFVQLINQRFPKPAGPWEKLSIELLNPSKDWDEAYSKHLKFLEKDPKNQLIIYLAGFMATHANRPALAIRHFESLGQPMLDYYGNTSDSWFTDWYARNLIRLDRLDEAKNILNMVPPEKAADGIYFNKLRIFVTKNQPDSILQLIREMEGQNKPRRLCNLMYLLASEWYAFQNNSQNQKHWAELAIEKINNRPESVPLDNYLLALGYYYTEQYDKALPLFQGPNYLENDPWFSKNSLLMREGFCRAKLGQKEEALKIIDRLKALELADDYQSGQYRYSIAGIYSGLGDKDTAVQYLKEAFQNMFGFRLTNYKYDFELIPLHGYKPFEDFVKPRD